MLYRAFVEEDDDNAIHRIEYYHTPSRWQDNALPENDPIRDEAAWSNEIKYLDKFTIIWNNFTTYSLSCISFIFYHFIS